jgi:beta-glucosidase/6-phospho-beta-glucosidase/beta-galactosidase
MSPSILPTRCMSLADSEESKFEDAFVNYGKIVLSHFADRVPIWVTFNEPLIYS